MRQFLALLSGVAVLILATSFVSAQGTSNNFRIDESYFGPGGSLESSSNNYSTAPGGQSLGNTGSGESESSNYKTQGGSQTTDDPRLACEVTSSALDFGNFSTSVTSVATATFSVLNYTAYGYVVQIVGDPPTNGSHTLSAMSSNGAANPGTEQFGINLVDNATPDIGSNPQQVPDNTFSFGQAATNYDTADSYRYVTGETIAQSNETSGQTDYTVSYIVDTATTTPGGEYSTNQSVVCVGTY